MTVYVADGTTIKRGNGASPEVFTVIPQVSGIQPVGQSRSLIDVSNLSSSAREYKKALKDGQEIQLDIQYDPDNAQHSALFADLNSEDARNFKITLTDSPAQVISFAAQVTNWSLENIAIDNVIMLKVTLKPTGDLVFT